MGVVPIGSTPEGLARQVRADQERWEPVIRQAGISMRD
jgi:tripartite-type tricarboxylate transporter receptor subunit TctC